MTVLLDPLGSQVFTLKEERGLKKRLSPDSPEKLLPQSEGVMTQSDSLLDHWTL